MFMLANLPKMATDAVTARMPMMVMTTPDLANSEMRKYPEE